MERKLRIDGRNWLVRARSQGWKLNQLNCSSYGFENVTLFF